MNNIKGINIGFASYSPIAGKEEANGKIDGDFIQNLQDCGLVASLFSISQTREGAQAIEDSLVIVRDEEDNILEYNVTFKGTGETYTITQDELQQLKVPDENGRCYATGDDDVTIYERAMEMCFEQSDDAVLREILNNYPHESDRNDALYGVTPASVSYLLLGEPFDTIKTNGDFEEFKTSAPNFIPEETYNVNDYQGNEIVFKEGHLYTATNIGTDGKHLYIKDNENQENFIINTEDFYNNVFAPNKEKTAKHARAILDNFEQNPLSNSVVFGTTGECTVECTNGTMYEFDKAHAYSVVEVEGDTVILANASAPDNAKYTVDKNSLLNIGNFWMYGSENQDSNELIVADAIEKESATYYPNLFSLFIDKFFGHR